MKSIYRVRERLVKVLPLHGKCVSIQPEDVVRVNLPDGWLNAVVEGWQTVVERITWLVDRVVAGYPGIVLVTFGDLSPEPNDTILVVLVVPESGVVSNIVRVPVGVLTARRRVKVQNCVDFVLRALMDCQNIYLRHELEYIQCRQPCQGA